MLGVGDGVVFLSASISLLWGIYEMFLKKAALYFKLIVGAVFCHVLGYLYESCQYFTAGKLSVGVPIESLGYIGCFLFLLTASVGYMDGILDDHTNAMKKSRRIAFLAPIVVILILLPNFVFELPPARKVFCALVGCPALFNAYFNLKHAILPDMDFGFVKAIRPFNISALLFTFFQLLHLTLSHFFDGMPLVVSGFLLGVSNLAMIFLARKGVKEWTL